MTPAIELRALTKRYRDLTAVDRLDLTVAEGELFALLGVNGAGKTTTVKMLSCLTAPTSGDALVFGHSIVREPLAVKRIIGVSPQETAVAPYLSVKENLELMCGIHGFSKEKTAQRCEELARDLGFDAPLLSKKACKLSGGWQRRLSIAMALITEPRLLFLDEPTLGLDVLARADLWEVIRSLKGKATVVLTTHYMEEAEDLADRVGIMKDGRLLALDTPQALLTATAGTRLEEAFIRIVKGGITK